MDLSSTHLPYLALAVLKFGGPVLEIGCGPYSTPLLRSLNVPVTSIEREQEWVKKMLEKGIEVRHEPVIRNALPLFTQQKWAIVFIDCHREDRPDCIGAFWNKQTIMVIHDTEVDYLKSLVERAKFERTFSEITPWTSWISNRIAFQ